MPNILLGPGEYAFEEKRSKFIACLEAVSTDDAARAVIEKVRTSHRTASHHVYAYGLRADHILRHSDDGEPQGTAGLPVLNVFIKEDVTDFVCVVTRYFGGTLLGAGGLVRAYAKAAKGALDAAGAMPLIQTKDYRIICPYAKLATLKYYIEKNNIEILQTEYGEQCEAVVRVTELQTEIFQQFERLYAYELRICPDGDGDAAY